MTYPKLFDIKQIIKRTDKFIGYNLVLKAIDPS